MRSEVETELESEVYMKAITGLTILTVVAAWFVHAAPPMNRSLEAELAGTEFKLKAQPTDPNELTVAGTTYSGVAVQFKNTEHPLQMINPTAPAEYGNGEQNVERDPITGQLVGLKVLSIDF